MMLPISITTRERTALLNDTIQGIIETTCYTRNDIYIYDDCSLNSEKEKSLNNLDELGYNVYIQYKNLGTFRNTKYAITNTFDKNPNADYLFQFQDDVEFSNDWHEESLKLLEKVNDEVENWSIISLICLRRLPNNEIVYNNYSTLEEGHQGGVAWIVRRDFWNHYLKDNKVMDLGNKNMPHISDYRISKWGQVHGWVVAFPHKSIIAHVGIESTIACRDMSQYYGIGFEK